MSHYHYLKEVNPQIRISPVQHYSPGHYSPGHYSPGRYSPSHYSPGHYSISPPHYDYSTGERFYNLEEGQRKYEELIQ